MDLLALEMEIAELETVYRPLATKPAPEGEVDPAETAKLVARISKVLRDLGVHDRAAAALRTAIADYGSGDEEARARIRRIFADYPSFRWATRLPEEFTTADEFRARLIHLSARDQADDARVEILGLDALCSRARQLGIDVAPIAREVAALSSEVDRHGLGSTRALILHYGAPQPGAPL